MSLIIPEFPHSLLRQQTSAWQLKASTVSPGQSASGAFARTSYGGGGLWQASYGSINLRTPDHVRTWRAIEAICDGGVNPIIVPMCDKRQAPFPTVDGVKLYSYGSIPHSDGSFFSDGSGYYQPVIVAEAGADAALRAVSLLIDFTYGGPLAGGEIFAINHPTQGWHVYEVSTVDEDGLATFRPPLREAVSAGDEIEFDRPRCVMMLSDPNAMQLTMTRGRFANPDVSFIEYFYPS